MTERGPMASGRALGLADSGIMGVLYRSERLHGARAVNLAAGIPDWEPDPAVLEAGSRLVRGGHHEYADPAGAEILRAALAQRVSAQWGRAVDVEDEITVTSGATAGLVAVLMALTDPGDEVLLFEPCYESHLAACELAGARPRCVGLSDGTWGWDEDDLRRELTPRTRAIVLNTPHNPTGKVFTRAELSTIAGFCAAHGLTAVSDEIYEAFVYEGEHASLAELPDAFDRAVTIGGVSKIYGLSGWRVGWVVAPPSLTAHIRRMHDYLTAGAPHPLQVACRSALTLPDDYYHRLRTELRRRRRLLVEGLCGIGMRATQPAGAYYVFADISRLGFESDVAFVDYCIEHAGVALVPGSVFYPNGGGRSRVRASFCVSRPTIERGLEALYAALRAGRR